MSGKGKPSRAQTRYSSPSREFATRLISAIVLAAVSLALTWAGPWPFTILVGLCSGALVWEWVRLRESSNPHGDTLSVALAVMAASVLACAGYILPGLLALAGGTAAAMTISRKRWAALGLLYIGLPAVAITTIRTDAIYGLHAVIFVLLVVWCTDIMAYVVGRLAGGPKVAPSISPGKTWSGCMGGLVFPAILAYAYALWLDGTSAALLAMLGIGLALATQIGDLAESALKRSAGIKDSGHLIPGHGGVLDRLDGFLFAAACAGILAALRDAGNPGQALLIWP